jgi:hypothetical protein
MEKKVIKGRNPSVFIVESDEDNNVVTAREGGVTTFEGSKRDYDTFVKQHKGSVFIIDDLPRVTA